MTEARWSGDDGGEVAPIRWRRIESDAADGAWNMAVDEMLMESVRDGGAPTLRFYRWARPCLSLGRNQPAEGAYARGALEASGIEVIRRPTGGRAVLHAHELTYSVVMPERLLGSPRRAYRAINEVLVAGLARLGAPAAVHAGDGARVPIPWSAPCFADPVAGEVLALGRKLVGSAQVSRSGVLLQHGSIPIEDTRPDGRSRGSGGGSGGDGPGLAPAAPPVGLAAILGFEPPWAGLAAALAEAWCGRVGPLERSALSAAERARAARLAGRYRDSTWTWRR